MCSPSFVIGEARAKAAEDKAKKRAEYMKTYTSPWERAMKGNEDLLATMKPQMPGPYSYIELCKYKNFNRCLTALSFLSSMFIEFFFLILQSLFITHLSMSTGVQYPSEALIKPLN